MASLESNFLGIKSPNPFWLASAPLPGFQVQGFVSAMVGAILYGVIAWALSALIPNKEG